MNIYKLFFLSFLLINQCYGQEQVIDEVVAVVGGKIVLKSEIENQYAQYIATGNPANAEVKCNILDQMMLTKLLLNQAILDSMEVSEEQVESELDRKIRLYSSQIGSEQKLEEYFKKSIIEIKAEYKELLKDQLLAQSMQSKITKEITVTPSEVKAYYQRIPQDSLPYINSEVEVAQITKKAPVNREQAKLVKEKLESIRERIIKGEEFSTLAVLYSEDPSSRKGGELGFIERGGLVPEFEVVAFSLKPNEVSHIVETQYGFHIIQLIERRGNDVNARHILLRPKVTTEDMAIAKAKIDSVHTLITQNKLTFAEAALKYSDDEESKNNGGTMVNVQTGSVKFEADQLDPSIAFKIEKMKVAEVSEPMTMTTMDGKQGFRIIMLKSRIESHRANLKDDYQRIQAAALTEKQNNAVKDWVSKKNMITFIQVNDQYKTCSSLQNWIKKK